MFHRVRVPETGAHISVHTDTLRAHPGLVPLDRPPAMRPGPDKPKKKITRRRRAAATEPEE